MKIQVGKFVFVAEWNWGDFGIGFFYIDKEFFAPIGFLWIGIRKEQ